MLRFGRAGAHAEEWWPDLSLSRAVEGVGAIRFRNSIVAPLLPYPEPAKLDEIIVVGTGPSLGAQARDRIPLDRAFLLNGAVHLLDPKGPPPLGLFVEDERFVWRRWRMIVEKVPGGTHCYLSTAAIRALCRTAPEWLASQAVHHLDFVHRPYGRKRPVRDDLHRVPFLRWSADGLSAISLDPQAGLMPSGTVAATAAQVALSFSPARIGFAGIDLTNTDKPRFYETLGDTAQSGLAATPDKILASFAAIRDECVERGIVLENYSPASRLAELGVPYVPRFEK
jgi:hypothetical protein